eukprot:7804280-Alexandrium_andersonii.AAC.1
MASSITDGGATMTKSPRYDRTRTRSAARSPTRSSARCLTTASACLTAMSTPAAWAIGAAGSPCAQPVSQ